MTRTYVHYFGEDQIEPLNAVLAEIQEDWSHRRLHISSTTRDEGDERLQMAMLTVKRLTDRVPE
jgi:hypothetical protein